MALFGRQDRFVIGIDFGTTFSGVAFTYSLHPEAADEITVVKDWPGSNNISSEKVPSELAYVPTADDFEIVNPNSNDALDILWGLQLKPEQSRLRCLKLRLDPRQELPHYVSAQDLTDQLLKCGKTTEEAISDYLSLVFTHALGALVLRFGQQMVSTTPIEVVLTVPAVWTDAAKDATLRVAKKAGMGDNLHMISEPEAAAIYALKSMEKETKILHAGDNFIVCDAGGGTIDEIRSLAPSSLVESAPGTGALCGSVFLNLRFEDLVKSRMGITAFEDLRTRRPKSWAIALRYFEDCVKKNFDPVTNNAKYDDSMFNVPLPGVQDNEDAGIDCGFITLSTAEVAELFRPLVDNVIELVERQRKQLLESGKTAKGVILVGGFGKSTYLFKCLKSRFADGEAPPTYTQVVKLAQSEPDYGTASQFLVMQPVNAWTAVVRGAVLSSLQEKIVLSRKARRHYGIRINRKFDEAVHSTKNKYWDIYTETYRARNQISWHANKGDDLPIDEPIIMSYSVRWNYLDPVPEYHKIKIIVSDASKAPEEYDVTVETRTLCRLNVDLTEVPRRRFKECCNTQDIRSRTLDFEVAMSVQSGCICFDLRVDDIVFGTIKADFE
ncbi:actin-like ATPase domain-containing protein [Aureobasidium pullulans]|uniref:Actin-like ATPase domain-containing protein n=1 Tax=Aureobasidium pullulans TaxID=5580 RepID=A0A4S8YYW1_AURPU|nr:actin-like ATPase domain-containing protein [Aureobasidium pullulans]